MGNIWCYDLLIPKPESISGTIDNVLKILESEGFVFHHPFTGSISIISSKRIEPLSFSSLNAAKDFLAKEDGSLTVWKLLDKDYDWYLDFGLGVYLVGDKGQRCGDRDNSLKELGFGEISIELDGVHYRQFEPEDTDRVIVAGLIQKLFIDLCVSQNAVYGYSVDEDAIEQFLYEIPYIPYLVKELQKPPVIFWLNYFSNEYIAKRNLELFHPLKLEELTNGTIATLSKYPWDVNLSTLRAANEEWHRLDFGQQG